MVLELFKKQAQSAIQPRGPAPQPIQEPVPQQPTGPEPLDISVMQGPYQSLVKMVTALQEIVTNPYSHHSENPDLHKEEIAKVATQIKSLAEELLSMTKKL